MKETPHDYALLNTLWMEEAPGVYRTMANRYAALTGRPIKWTYVRRVCEAGWAGPLAIPRYRKYQVDPMILQPILDEDPFLISHNQALTEAYNLKAEVPVARYSVRAFTRAHGIAMIRRSPNYEPEIEEAILNSNAQGWIFPPREVEEEKEDG